MGRGWAMIRRDGEVGGGQAEVERECDDAWRAVEARAAARGGCGGIRDLRGGMAADVCAAGLPGAAAGGPVDTERLVFAAGDAAADAGGGGRGGRGGV